MARQCQTIFVPKLSHEILVKMMKDDLILILYLLSIMMRNHGMLLKLKSCIMTVKETFLGHPIFGHTHVRVPRQKHEVKSVSALFL
jgi:hypothetical protein